MENEITGIEKEIDAYNELTQTQIDDLKASKNLHDYEQSIAEKTKSVTDPERQIAAMLNDDSAATVAKRKKLEKQLAEAKKDLEETEYDHSIEAQENALNKQFEDYENARNNDIDALRESLNDKEAILAASFETVRANASLIGQEKADVTGRNGRKIASLKKNKAVTVSASNGVLVGGALAAQTATEIEQETFNVRITDVMTVKDNACKTSKTAVGMIGAEIGSIYVKNANGSLGTRLEQGAAAAAGTFTYKYINHANQNMDLTNTL